MSYIDTFDHEFVGFFGHLPVYHPLETISIDAATSPDFNCDPTNLVIGGGTGEHPAIVLRRPDCAVAHFVSDWLARYQPSTPKSIDTESIWYPGWDGFLDELLDVSAEVVLHFAGWDTKTHHHFYQRCLSEAMYSPYKPSSNGWFEWWIAACLGEYVFFSFPELVPHLDKLLPEANTIITRPLYVNILTPPPGFNVPYGSIREGNKRIQGVNRWRKQF